jgi:iron complex transport system ATP-binding protein
MSSIEVQSITLAYENDVIIRNLSLSIPRGGITALVGPNGCGKSTLLRGLSRLLKPRGGAVLLDGRDIWSMPTKVLAQQLGILPQSPVTPEGLTVYELVAQGRYPHQTFMQQWTADDERLAQEALRITGLTELSDRPVDSLSGGQRQRAWIAMTLAQDTDYLLLDEPTTFLDLAFQIDVLDLLDDLHKEGKTIIMVLHDLNHACRYADHLITLREGSIEAQGNPAAILDEVLVERVFGIRCQIIPDPVTGTPLVVPIGRNGKHSATLIASMNGNHNPLVVHEES